MSKRIWPVMVLALILGAGCASVRVSEERNPDVDFTGMDTFAWHREGPPGVHDESRQNPDLHLRIRNAIEQTLEGGGYRKVERSAADFLVAYRLDTRRKIVADKARASAVFGDAYPERIDRIGFGVDRAIATYDKGVLTIDVLAPEGGELLWRGKGTDTVSELADPKDVFLQVEKVVEKILAQFPPA